MIGVAMTVFCSGWAEDLESQWQSMGGGTESAQLLVGHLKQQEGDIPPWLSAAANPDGPVGSADRQSGGPDGFGYIWKESGENGGPTFNWVELTTRPGAVNVALIGDDVTNSTPIALPWSFPFYGVGKTGFRVCTNGFLNFGASSTDYVNGNLPMPDAPNDCIYPYWDDLSTSAHGSIWYYNDTANGRFIVEWYEVPQLNTTLYNTFEVILYPNGQIIVQYLTINGCLNSCTLGIENGTGTHGLVARANGSGGFTIANNKALKFYIPTGDEMGPTISHYGLPNTDENIPYDITASISDSQSGVNSATLFYRLNGGSWTELAMSVGVPPIWTASIPGQVSGTVIDYYIRAIDGALPPNSTTTVTMTFHITFPTFLVTNVSATQRHGSQLVDVRYDVLPDNGQFASISALFSLDGGLTWTIQPQTTSGDYGPLVIPGMNHLFTWDAHADFPGALLNNVKVKVIACRSSVPVMLPVPAGSFVMGPAGGGGPDHNVTLTNAFQLGRTEVTNRQYMEALNWALGNGLVSVIDGYVAQYGLWLLDVNYYDLTEIRYNECTQQFFLQAGTWNDGEWGPGFAYPSGYDPADFPVMGVSWEGAACYCDWISQMNELPAYYNGNWSQIPIPNNPYAAEGFRLPTEAEWEFAAQYDDERNYPWGSAERTCTLANCVQSDVCVGWTSPVGTYPTGVSNLGFHDMVGNVEEYVNDWYESYTSSPQINPIGPTSGLRIPRGGSWKDSSCNSSYRYYLPPLPPLPGHPSPPEKGFRICKTL